MNELLEQLATEANSIADLWMKLAQNKNELNMLSKTKEEALIMAGYYAGKHDAYRKVLELKDEH